MQAFRIHFAEIMENYIAHRIALHIFLSYFVNFQILLIKLIKHINSELLRWVMYDSRHDFPLILLVF